MNLHPGLLRVAKSLGISEVRCKAPRYEDLPWDGETLLADNDLDLAHEIAHFQVAPPSRRFEPNFGLGKAYAGDYAPLRVSIRTAFREEAAADLLGIFWLRTFELCPDAQTEWESNDWDDLSLREVLGIGRSLKRLGLLSGKRPLLNVRQRGTRL